MASWAEDVNRYQEEKQRPPLQREEQVAHRLYRDKRYNKQTEHRAYDILTHAYRDESRERTAQMQEAETLMGASLRAQDNDIKYQSNYNVVTNLRKRDNVLEEDPNKVKFKRLTPGPKPEPRPTGTSNYFWPNHAGKDFHILNNRYKRDHEGRTQAEHEALEQSLSAKFFEKNHYNPVTAAFYHPDEEARFQKERIEAGIKHGQSKMARNPPFLTMADGERYNVVSLQTKDRGLMGFLENRELEQSHTSTLKHQFETEFRGRDQAQADKFDARRLATVSYQRHQETLNRGYNILSHQPHNGRGGRAPPPPCVATKPPVSTWEQLERTNTLYKSQMLPTVASPEASAAPGQKRAVGFADAGPQSPNNSDRARPRGGFGGDATAVPGVLASSGVPALDLRQL